MMVGSGLPAEVHAAGAPGIRGQDPVLQVQRTPGNKLHSILYTLIVASDFSKIFFLNINS